MSLQLSEQQHVPCVRAGDGFNKFKLHLKSASVLPNYLGLFVFPHFHHFLFRGEKKFPLFVFLLLLFGLFWFDQVSVADVFLQKTVWTQISHTPVCLRLVCLKYSLGKLFFFIFAFSYHSIFKYFCKIFYVIYNLRQEERKKKKTFCSEPTRWACIRFLFCSVSFSSSSFCSHWYRAWRCWIFSASFLVSIFCCSLVKSICVILKEKSRVNTLVGLLAGDWPAVCPEQVWWG